MQTLERENIMPFTFDQVKAEILPPDLLRQCNLAPSQIITVTITVNDDDIDVDGQIMPPQSAFKESFVQAIKASEESYKRGDFTRCSTDEEDNAFFNDVWGNDDK